MTETPANPFSREKVGPRRLGQLGAATIRKALDKDDPALASETLEKVAKIVGCWPMPAWRAAKAAERSHNDAAAASAAALPPRPPPMTDEEWLEKFGPPA
jgi:hypothetical protein